MAITYIKETTSNWKTDYRVPQHTYIMENARCIGYIKEGTTEELLFSKPSSQFAKKGRTFATINKSEII
jgi:hypothetical protein